MASESPLPRTASGRIRLRSREIGVPMLGLHSRHYIAPLASAPVPDVYYADTCSFATARGERKMEVFADGKIEAFVGPPGLGAADDLEQVIVQFIDGARSSLDIAVQELDSRAIAQAILDARWRGVDVDMFLEQDYLKSPLKGRPPNVPKPKPGETQDQALHRVQWDKDETELAENRRILAALLRSDIEVKGDYNPEIFHQKFVLRDYRDGKALPTSALLCRSANFTLTLKSEIERIISLSDQFDPSKPP